MVNNDTKPVDGLGEATVKACPFCGDSRAEFNSGWKCYRVDCGAAGPTYSDPDKATERWNTRPIEDALTQRVKVLEEAMGKCLLFANDALVTAQRKPESEFHDGKAFVGELVKDVCEEALAPPVGEKEK